MKKLIYLSGVLMMSLACNAPTGSSEIENNEELKTDSDTLKEESNVDFSEHILGEYVEVEYEVVGEDTLFYKCEDADVTQVFRRDDENEGQFLNEYSGLQDRWVGVLLSATETERGFEVESACMEYPECDASISEYTYYRYGFMTDRGIYYVAKENLDKFEKRHCGFYDEEQFF